MNILDSFTKVFSEWFCISMQSVDFSCSQILIKVIINLQNVQNFDLNNNQQYTVYQEVFSIQDLLNINCYKINSKNQEKSVIFMKLHLQKLFNHKNFNYEQAFCFTDRLILKKAIIGQVKILNKFESDLTENKISLQKMMNAKQKKDFLILKVPKSLYNQQMVLVLPKIVSSHIQQNSVLTPLKKQILSKIKKESIVKKLFFTQQ